MVSNTNINQILVEKNEELKSLKQISFSLKKLSVQTSKENKELKKELKRQTKRAEEAELDASSHFHAIKACEDWYFTNHIIPLNKEVANKSELLLESQGIIEGKDKEIEKLRNELKTERNLLEDALNTIEEKDKLIGLSNKPLPKKPSKFRIFKSKIKTKIHHLTEKVKHQGQELVARIEVRTN